MNLSELRERIDKLDVDLVRLLNERIALALEIGKLKQEKDAEVYVPAREKAVLDRVQALNDGPLSDDSIRAIYREVMSAALSLERNVSVAYLGPPATFTYQAARSRFGGSVNYMDCGTITDVFHAVQKRTADYGVVPIENSTEGAVTHTLDEFIDTPLKICAEIYLPISHHLMATSREESLQRIYSIPQVFGQCRIWLHQNMPDVELVAVSSTAKAAETAAAESGSGALASKLAAELYNLEVLAENIQDLSGNMTRFLVLGKEYGGPTGSDKTSIFFSVRHKVGALYEALESFKESGINMSKIESRPSKAKVWEYFFFVDLVGHAEDEAMKMSLNKLAEHCQVMTILGAYPRAAEPSEGRG